MRVEEALIVLDAVPEAYVRLDSECYCTFANQAVEPILGRTRNELLGKRLEEFCSSSAGAPLEDACRRAMNERVTVTLEHYSESRYRWYAVNVIPDSSGGIVVRFADITDRKLIENALRKSEEKFSKAFRSSPAAMC